MGAFKSIQGFVIFFKKINNNESYCKLNTFLFEYLYEIFTSCQYHIDILTIYHHTAVIRDKMRI